MTDEAFARAFERGDVSKEDFTHASHLRVAWVYLREEPSRDAAVDRIRGAIQRFAAKLGASQKYHETITVAWMILLDEARARMPADAALADVLLVYPALADKNLPLSFYSRDRLFSDAARTAWVAPDLGPIAVDSTGPAA